MKHAVSITAAMGAAAVALIVFPAVGQHAGHQASPPPASLPSSGDHAGHGPPAATPASPAAPPGHDHGTKLPASAPPSVQDHSGHAMPGAKPVTAADLPVGHDPAPLAIVGAADAIFGAATMAGARGVLAGEHGDAFLWKVMVEQAEYRAGPHGAAYGWDAEAWFGGDIHRFVLKTEGEGDKTGLEEAEWQALYSRAIGPYTDLQLGLRQDVAGYVASYATFGVEAVLPYWFKADAAFFVSAKGDVLARLHGSYDLMLAQRVVLQPALELNFALQDVPAAILARGVTDITAGLRVRYDISRNFSPYLGVEYRRKIGGTKALYRTMGADF